MPTVKVDIQGRGPVDIEFDNDPTPDDILKFSAQLAPPTPSTGEVVKEAATSGLLRIGKQAAAVGQVVGDVIPDMLGGDSLSKFGAEKADSLNKRIAEHVPENMSLGQEMVFGGVSSAAAALPYVFGGAAVAGIKGAASIPGVVGATTWGMGAGAGAEKYSDLQAAGFSKGTSALNGVITGLTEKFTEHISLGAILQGGPLKTMFYNYLKRELPGEQVAAVVDAAQSKLTTNPDMTWGEFGHDLLVTAGATFVGGPLQVGAGKLAQTLVQPFSGAQNDSGAMPPAESPAPPLAIPSEPQGANLAAFSPPQNPAESALPNSVSVAVNKELTADTFLELRKPVEQGEIALFRVEPAGGLVENLPAYPIYTTNPDKVLQQVKDLNNNAVVRQIKATPAMLESVPGEVRAALQEDEVAVGREIEMHLRTPLHGKMGELVAPADRDVIWRPGPAVKAAAAPTDALGDINYSVPGLQESEALEIPRSALNTPEFEVHTSKYPQLERYIKKQEVAQEYAKAANVPVYDFTVKMNNLLAGIERANQALKPAVLAKLVDLSFPELASGYKRRITAELYKVKGAAIGDEADDTILANSAFADAVVEGGIKPGQVKIVGELTPAVEKQAAYIRAWVKRFAPSMPVVLIPASSSYGGGLSFEMDGVQFIAAAAQEDALARLGLLAHEFGHAVMNHSFGRAEQMTPKVLKGLADEWQVLRDKLNKPGVTVEQFVADWGGSYLMRDIDDFVRFHGFERSSSVKDFAAHIDSLVGREGYLFSFQEYLAEQMSRYITSKKVDFAAGGEVESLFESVKQTLASFFKGVYEKLQTPLEKLLKPQQQFEKFVNEMQDLVRNGKEYRPAAEVIAQKEFEDILAVDQSLGVPLTQVENTTEAVSKLQADSDGYVKWQDVATALNKSGVSQYERDIVAGVKDRLQFVGNKISLGQLMLEVSEQLLPIKTSRQRWGDLGDWGFDSIGLGAYEPVTVFFDVPGYNFNPFETHYDSPATFGHVRTAALGKTVYIAEIQSDVLSEVNRRARQWNETGANGLNPAQLKAAALSINLKDDKRWQALQKNFGKMAIRKILSEAVVGGQHTVYLSHPDTMAEMEQWPTVDFVDLPLANERLASLRNDLADARASANFGMVQHYNGLIRQLENQIDEAKANPDVLNAQGEFRYAPAVRGIYRNHRDLYNWTKSAFGGTDMLGAMDQKWLQIPIAPLVNSKFDYTQTVFEEILKNRVDSSTNALLKRYYSGQEDFWGVGLDLMNIMQEKYSEKDQKFFIRSNLVAQGVNSAQLDAITNELYEAVVKSLAAANSNTLNIQFAKHRPSLDAAGNFVSEVTGDKSFSWSFKVFQGAIQSGLQLNQLAKILPNVRGLQQYRNVVRTMFAAASKMMVDANKRIEQFHAISKDRTDKIYNFLIDEAFKGGHLTSIMQDAQGRWVHRPNENFIKEMKKRGIEDKDALFIVQLKQDFLDRLGDMERVLSKNISSAFANDATGKAVRLAEIRKDFQTMRYKAFLPSSRFGRYALKVKAKTDFTLPSGEVAKSGQTIYFATYESQKERDMERQRVSGMLPGHDVSSSYIGEKLAPLARLPIHFVNELKKQLILTEEEEQVVDGLSWDASREGAFKRYIESGKKYIAGASRDVRRVYADYMWHTANAVSRMEYTSELKDSIREVERQGQEDTNNDSTQYDRIAESLRRNFEYVTTPQNEWQAARAAVSLWYLVASPKTALMNLSSLPVVTYPYLASRFGDAKALGAITKSIKDVSQFWQKGSNLSEDERLVLQWAKEDGITDQSFAAELASASTSTVLERTLPNFMGNSKFLTSAEQRAKRTVWKTVHWGMAPFRVTEGLLRQTTLLAAYRLGVQSGLPHASLAERAAYSQAIDAVEYTQNNYAAWNKVPVMRGKRGIFLIFYSFVQHMSFFMFGGDKGWWRSLMVMASLAGLQGLPGAENLFDVLNWTWKKVSGEHTDFRVEAREFAKQLGMNPDLAMHGMAHFGLGSGWEASSSVGMGRIVPGTEAIFGEGQLAERFLRSSAEVGGPAGNLFISLLQFLSDENPNTMARLDKVLPPALRNIERMHRYETEGGVFDRAGNELMGKLTTPQLIGVGLGFRPSELASKQEVLRMQRDAEEFWGAKRARLRAAFVHSIESADKDAITDARQAIIVHNKSVPFRELAITTKDLHESVKRRRTSNARTARGLSTSRTYDRLHQDVQERAQ